MANVIYNSFKGSIGKSINWETDSIKVMLVTSGYTPNIDTHTVIGDVSSEITGTGYTAGGKELIGKLVTINTIDDLAKYDGDDITWGTSTITARGAVIYDTTISSSLIAFIDFGVDKISSNGDFKIEWNIDGIFELA